MKLSNLYNKIPNWVIFLFQVILFAFIMQYLVDNVGKWGAWGFILFILIYCGIMIFRKRDNFMSVIRTVETKIWGRPLDRIHGRPPKLIIGKKDD